MGITGTTAAEAAGTIEGSVATMKAAWQNMLVGIADEISDRAVIYAAMGLGHECGKQCSPSYRSNYYGLW